MLLMSLLKYYRDGNRSMLMTGRQLEPGCSNIRSDSR